MNIEKTAKTPRVKFENGVLEISGNSISDNSGDFYALIMHQVKEYCKSPAEKTKIKISLEYFNTQSSKYLLYIFKEFQKLHELGSDVKVEWSYQQDDIDMFEAGEDYQAIINMPFELKKK